MRSKKRLLLKSKLYFILDIDTIVKPPLEIIEKILDTQVIDIVQLRDKSDSKSKVYKLASSIKKILDRSNILFVINDYLDIAKIVDADGIHLGQNDLPISIARKLLGNDKIIGISCHSLQEARESQIQGADYISIGPIFPTSLKPEYKNLGIDILKKLKDRISIPYFAVGGIDLSNIDKMISLNIDRFAFSRLLGTARNPEYILNRLKEKFILR